MGKGNKSKFVRTAEVRGARKELKDKKKAEVQMAARDSARAALEMKRGKKSCHAAATTIHMGPGKQTLVLKLIGLLDKESSDAGMDIATAIEKLGLGANDEDEDDDEDEDEDEDEEGDGDNDSTDRDDDDNGNDTEEEEGGDGHDLLAEELLGQQRRELEKGREVKAAKATDGVKAAKLGDGTGPIAASGSGSSCSVATPPPPSLSSALLRERLKDEMSNAQLPPCAPTVRLQLCSTKGKMGQTPKPVVVQRACGLHGPKGLVELARRKTNMTSNKYGTLLVLPQRQVLDEAGLLRIGVDTVVMLCTERDVPKDEPSSSMVGERPGNEAYEDDKEVEKGEGEGEGREGTAPVETITSVNEAAALTSSKAVPFSALATYNASSTNDAATSTGLASSQPDEATSALMYKEQQQRLGPFTNGGMEDGAYEGLPEILRQRQSLPIFAQRSEILHTVRTNTVTVIAGETGSGKTTQIPQYLLEDMVERGQGSECLIICTQPRRVAAVSVAERVAYERGERVGHTTGYQVRLNARMGNNTRILYCTTGVLLRRLQSQSLLNAVSHIVIDEVHERQVETDFLLALLKRNLESSGTDSTDGSQGASGDGYAGAPAGARARCKVVLMSATVQETAFSGYFWGAPVLCVKGRTFPVKYHYQSECLELISAMQQAKSGGKGNRWVTEGKGKRKDNGDRHRMMSQGADTAVGDAPQFNAARIADLIIAIVRKYSVVDRLALTRSGPDNTKGQAILVFLSGIQHIDKVHRALQGVKSAREKLRVLTLHSSQPPHEQRRVFEPALSEEWKVVLATNIAETSITIDDVTHVIDSGLVKEMQYEPAGNLSTLREVVISRASARQRAGRAGRVRAGHCWRLYSELFYEGTVKEKKGKEDVSIGTKGDIVGMRDTMREYSSPEIQRTPLDEVILQVLLLGLGHPAQFLRACLDPPASQQVHTSVITLLEMGAVVPSPCDPALLMRNDGGGAEAPSPPHDLPWLALTYLGLHLAKMPVDVRLGKLLIVGALFNCVEEALTIAAGFCGKSPFSVPPHRQEEAQQAHAHFHRADSFFSDHLAIAAVFEGWAEARAAVSPARRAQVGFDFCRKHYLNQVVLLEMECLRESLRGYLRDSGFVSASGTGVDVDASARGDTETSSGGVAKGSFRPPVALPLPSRELVRCVLCAALGKNVVKMCLVNLSKSKDNKRQSHAQQTVKMYQRDGREVSIHMSSLTCKHVSSLLGGKPDDPSKGISNPRNVGQREAFIVYHKMVQSGAGTQTIYIHDATHVPPLGVLLFAGDDALTVAPSKKDKGKKNKKKGPSLRLTVDGWIRMRASELTAALVRRLQRELDVLLQLKVQSPDADTGTRQVLLIRVVEELLRDDK